MAMPIYRTCPGCGVGLPISEGVLVERDNASPECAQLYSDLTAYTLTRGDAEFIHQHALDTYGAQHAGPASRPIAVAFSVIGLYLACERGHTGRQVQHMHMLLAQRTKVWPRFVLPQWRGDVTVREVMTAMPGADRDDRLRQWERSVWAAWGDERDHVIALLSQVMAD